MVTKDSKVELVLWDSKEDKEVLVQPEQLEQMVSVDQLVQQEQLV